MRITTASDYAQLAKEYRRPNQRQSLWEQFFTGVEQTYGGLTQQAQETASYDISQAYANYKQQQLQLQMNEQLGEGFKQQMSEQLQSAYGTAYSDIKSQEASTLYDIETQKAKTLQAGEERFAALGEQLRTYDKLISEYAELAKIARPENATTVTQDERGILTEELTDYGRLWYSDVLNAASSEGTFDKWLLSETSLSDIDYEDRVAVYEAYKQNPELFRQQVAGIDANFDAEATRTRLAEEEHATALTNIQSVSTDELKTIWSDTRLENLTTKQLVELKAGIDRNSNLISIASESAVDDAKGLFDNESFRDNYGILWDLTNWSNSTKNISGQYKTGDIIAIDGKYAVVTKVEPKKVRYTYIKKVKGVENPTSSTVKPILP